ncbi:MAG: peptidylprolyl isomerase [Bacteroidaceae bacterium]|nr:peptidylprolyl isomerase [Bacteroidaceae bacterium]
MKKNLIILAIMATLLGSCGAGSARGRNIPAEPETEILFRTTMGNIRIKLYNETPEHRFNFVRLVDEHYFDSLLFHRVIRDFMIQAGDPESKGADKGTRLGAGGPGYTLPAEFIYPQYYHKRGALSAARQADQVNPDRRSSGSQFYIVTGRKYRESELRDMEKQLQQQEEQSIFNTLCMENRELIVRMQNDNDDEGLMKLQKQLNEKLDSIVSLKGKFHFTDEQVKTYEKVGGTPFLDNQYTVFGEVIEGMEIVDKIQKVRTDENDRPEDDVMIISTEVVK